MTFDPFFFISNRTKDLLKNIKNVKIKYKRENEKYT